MLTDIKHRMTDRDIKALISHSIFEPTESKLERIADEYLTHDNRFMLGYELSGRIVGCAGVETNEPGIAVLHHVAIDPSFRGRGIGRAMIDEIMRSFALKHLEAETDDDAVGFYRNCGFNIINLGEKYPGTIRYQCVYQSSAPQGGTGELQTPPLVLSTGERTPVKKQVK